LKIQRYLNAEFSIPQVTTDDEASLVIGAYFEKACNLHTIFTTLRLQ